MGKQAVVFAGSNSLDQISVRFNVVRIPEVSIRLREAQSHIEAMGVTDIDLASHITSDDSVFLKFPKLKAVCVAIVQVGLFDRAMKADLKAEFFVGVKAADSALNVASGKQTLKQLLANSGAFQAEELSMFTIIPVPMLSTVGMMMLEVIKKDGTELAVGNSDAKQVLHALQSQEGITQFVNIGPVPLLSLAEQEAVLGSASVEDSIERDPVLGWFWSSVMTRAAAV
jgi:hypothetical protein